MKSIVFLLLFTGICLFGCSPKSPKNTAQSSQTPAVVETPMVGNDADTHGCKGSAGYTWSILKNKCIRIFEDGIGLEVKAADLDKSLSAFVVFKSENEDNQVEMYIPRENGSVLLKKDAKIGSGKWANDKYILSQWKGVYTLEDTHQKVLYQGAKE